MSKSLLEINDLKKYFPITGGLLKKKIAEVKAIDGVTFNVEKGTTVALVGESGSGKTTVGKSLIGVHTPTSGHIKYDGDDVTQLADSSLKDYRRKVQMVFQDPTSSLNPRRKIMDIVMDPLNVGNIGTKTERYERVLEMMDRVELPQDFVYRYPHSLSGGQKQRVGIARALVTNPELIVLDEPTASLDVSVQANIISLLKDLQQKYKLTYVFISHNLSLVRNIADTVIVMYLGRIMEEAKTSDLFKSPKHPYSEALLSVIPTVTEEEDTLLPNRIKLEGEIPSAMKIPDGCRFVTRCPEAFDHCSQVEPEMLNVSKRLVRCHLFDKKVSNK